MSVAEWRVAVRVLQRVTSAREVAANVRVISLNL